MSGELIPEEVERELKSLCDEVSAAGKAFAEKALFYLPAGAEQMPPEAVVQAQLENFNKVGESLRSDLRQKLNALDDKFQNNRKYVSEELKKRIGSLLINGNNLVNPQNITEQSNQSQASAAATPKPTLGQEVIDQIRAQVTAKIGEAGITKENAESVVTFIASVLSNPKLLTVANAALSFVPGGTGPAARLGMSIVSQVLPVVSGDLPKVVGATSFPQALGYIVQAAVQIAPIVTLVIPGAQAFAIPAGIAANLLAPIAGKVVTAVAQEIEDKAKEMMGVAPRTSDVTASASATIPTPTATLPDTATATTAERSNPASNKKLASLTSELRSGIRKFSQQNGPKRLTSRRSKNSGEYQDRNNMHAQGPRERAEKFCNILLSKSGTNVDAASKNALVQAAERAFTVVDSKGMKSFNSRTQLDAVMQVMANDPELPNSLRQDLVTPLAAHVAAEEAAVKSKANARVANRKELQRMQQSPKTFVERMKAKAAAKLPYGLKSDSPLSELADIVRGVRMVNHLYSDDDVRAINLQDYGKGFIGRRIYNSLKRILPEKVALFTYAQLEDAGIAKVRQMSPKQIAALSAQPLDGEQSCAIDFIAKHLNDLKPSQLRALSGAQLKRIASENIDALNNMEIPLFGRAKITYINPQSLAQIAPDDFAKIAPKQIRAMLPKQIDAITEDQWKKMTRAQIQNIKGSTIKKLDPKTIAKMGEKIKELTPKQFRYLQVKHLNAITKEQWNVLSKEQIRKISPNKISKLSLEAIANMGVNINKLSGKQFAALTRAQLRSLTRDQMHALKEEQLKAITGKQLDNLKYSQIKELSADQIKLISTKAIKAMSGETIAKFGTKIAEFTDKQLKALQAKHLNNMTPLQWQSLSAEQIKCINPAAIRRMSPEAIKDMGDRLADFSLKQLNALTSQHLNAMSPEQWQSLSPEQIRSLNPAAIKRMSPEAIRNMGTQIQHFSTSQMRALRARHLDAMSAAQFKSLKGWQIRAISPSALRNMDPATLAKMGNKVAELSERQIRALRHTHIEAMAQNGQIELLSTPQIRAISAKALNRISVDALLKFGDKVLDFKPSQIRGLTADHLNAIYDKLSKFTPAQVRNISARAVGGLSDYAIESLGRNVAQLKGSKLRKLKKRAQLRAISADAIAKFSVSQIKAMRSWQWAQIDPQQLSVLRDRISQLQDKKPLSFREMRELTLLEKKAALIDNKIAQYHGALAHRIYVLQLLPEMAANGVRYLMGMERIFKARNKYEHALELYNQHANSYSRELALAALIIKRLLRPVNNAIKNAHSFASRSAKVAPAGQPGNTNSGNKSEQQLRAGVNTVATQLANRPLSPSQQNCLNILKASMTGTGINCEDDKLQPQLQKAAIALDKSRAGLTDKELSQALQAKFTDPSSPSPSAFKLDVACFSAATNAAAKKRFFDQQQMSQEQRNHYDSVQRRLKDSFGKTAKPATICAGIKQAWQKHPSNDPDFDLRAAREVSDNLAATKNHNFNPISRAAGVFARAAKSAEETALAARREAEEAMATQPQPRAAAAPSPGGRR